MANPEEHKYAHALNLIPGLGPVRLKKTFEHFKSFANIWQAGDAALASVLDDPALASTVLEKRRAINPEQEFQKLISADIRVMLVSDPDYPNRLRTIPVPPQLLYIKGNLPNPDQPTIAIVGSRKPTSYGLEACEVLTRGLVQAGIAIISGLARGIDAQAHESALANGGYTAAVLGSGIDDSVLYPATNRGLASRIISTRGALISEYHPRMKAELWTFPQRNRIVAGMADGVLVVEASAKSGALITANFALETAREVFAVPGQIFYDTAAGPNRLITLGATPVSSAPDILEALGIETPSSQEGAETFSASPEEKEVLTLLDEPRTRDEIIRALGGNAAEINQRMGLLEIRGMIKNAGGGMYRRV